MYILLYKGGFPMRAITYSEARQRLAPVIDSVVDDKAPIIITKKGEKAVVMMSLEEYEALEETAYLLRSPANARRLVESIRELDAGGGSPKELREE